MSVLRPRNRLVYSRVSEDEYQRFSRMCQSTGSRSTSDLARSAMEGMIRESDDGSKAPGSRDLTTTLESLISEVNHKVDQLKVSLNAHHSCAPPVQSAEERASYNGDDV